MPVGGPGREPEPLPGLMAGVPATDVLASRRRDAAARYVRALVDHDPTGVPFHSRCLRVENGLPTGLSAADLRFQLRYSPAYRFIEGVQDLRITSVGDRVRARFLLIRAVGSLRSTAEVTQWFSFEGARITRIDARIRRPFQTAGLPQGV